MPRKIRQLKADLAKAGFEELKGRGKGSHSWWSHSDMPQATVNLSGQDGDAADHYQEREVRAALERVRRATDEGAEERA